MTPEMPKVGDYLEAVKLADLAGAARHWQAAIRSPLADDLKREFDFSLVQDYSLAWQTGDLKMLQVIGKKAIAQPDHHLSHLLAKVVDSHAETLGSTHPETVVTVSETVSEGDCLPLALKHRGRDFLKGLVQASRQGGDVASFAKKYRSEKVERVTGKTETFSKTEKPIQPAETPLTPADNFKHHQTLKHLIDFLNQSSIRNKITITDLEIEILRNHQDLELPQIKGNQDFDRWAIQQNLQLSAKSLKQLYRASLLLVNRMTATETTSLAMAARSAQTKKKAPKPPPENPIT